MPLSWPTAHSAVFARVDGRWITTSFTEAECDPHGKLGHNWVERSADELSQLLLESAAK